MKTFEATEFRAGEVVPTGRVVIFLAETLDEAIRKCLYTEKLKNAYARLGPTGRVVYSGGFAYSFPNPKWNQSDTTDKLPTESTPALKISENIPFM